MIEIGERFKPFTLVSGTPLLLPGSSLEFRIYPTRLFVQDLHSNWKTQMERHVKKPQTHIVITQNLERGWIEVKSDKAYKINAAEGGFRVGEEFVASPGIYKCLPSKERLSFGVHKKQDIDLMKRRRDLREMLPFWFLLGNQLPEMPGSGGTLSLALQDALIAGFSGLFRPHLEDVHFFGFTLPEIAAGTSPLSLLSQGAKKIREMFVRSSENTITLLPKLVSARLIHTPVLKGKAELSFEWSKHQPFRVMITAHEAVSFTLRTPLEIKEFRVRNSVRERGKVVLREEVFSLQQGQTIYMDRFKK